MTASQNEHVSPNRLCGLIEPQHPEAREPRWFVERQVLLAQAVRIVRRVGVHDAGVEVLLSPGRIGSSSQNWST